MSFRRGGVPVTSREEVPFVALTSEDALGILESPDFFMAVEASNFEHRLLLPSVTYLEPDLLTGLHLLLMRPHNLLPVTFTSCPFLKVYLV